MRPPGRSRAIWLLQSLTKCRTSHPCSAHCSGYIQHVPGPAPAVRPPLVLHCGYHKHKNALPVRKLLWCHARDRVFSSRMSLGTLMNISLVRLLARPFSPKCSHQTVCPGFRCCACGGTMNIICVRKHSMAVYVW